MAEAPIPLTDVGQRLFDMLGALAEQSPAEAAVLCSAAATMFDEAGEILAESADGSPGWPRLFDPDQAPAFLLDWLAQFVGVTLPPGLDEAQQRLRIKQTDGRQRGRPAAIKGAARQHLIGPDGTGESATVYLTERVGGSPYEFNVTTLLSETPDQDKVLAALLEQKPAGRRMNYTAITGGDWQSLISNHADWAEVQADFATWGDVIADPAHT